jgi:uncharacterized membrane protein
MRIALAVLTLAYPFIVYFGLGHFEPRTLAFLLAALALLRAIATRQAIWLAAACGAIVLGGASFVSNQLLPLKLYPVLVSVVLLVLFGVSLIHPPSMIERLARLREPDLPPAAVRYTRRVTEVWCAFFICNGTIALVTALYASTKVWTFYNGFLSYLLMGTLMAGEWLVRQRIKTPEQHG